jgi:hypothetical protein
MRDHPLLSLYRDLMLAGKSFDNFCNILFCLNEMLKEIPENYRDDIIDHLIEFLKKHQSAQKM